MKKFFSAFLLMAMMVASVGSFVSCSDIEDAIANVETSANNNATAIESLKSEVAALKTALATAQAEAAAAKTEANAAKQAAATAKAEAIAAALAEIEKVDGDVKAMQAVIDSINAALTGKADKATVELLQATLDEYKALNDAAVKTNADAIAAIEEALAALGENVTPEQLAEVVAKMEAVDAALVAFQNRLQSVSYVPEWVEGPTAVLFAENEDYGYVHMSYEVAPADYASKITAENTKLVGVALKGVEVEEHDVKILNADPETGIVEVIAYIGVDSEVWKAENAAVALRVVAEDAQFTSAYENVKVLGATKEVSINDVVYFGTYNEDGDFTTGNITHKVAYNTAVEESEVALFEGLVARVNVPGFFEYVPVEEAAEMFGIEIEVSEKLSSYATKYFVTTNAKAYDLVEDAKKEKDTPAFVVANDQSLDITVKFNEAVVKYLTDNDDEKDLTDLVDKTAKAELKPGFFQVNGKKSTTFAGLTATYKVTGLEKTIELVLNNDEALNIEWSTENYTNKSAIVVKDIDVTGGDARHLLGQECTMTAVDEEGKTVAGAPEVKVKFISVDNADVTVALTEWPEEAVAYTYTFSDEYKDAETQATETTVTVTFDLTVAIEAAPESIGEVPVAESLTVTLVKSGEYVADPTNVATVVALNGVVEKLLPYYKSYYETEKDAKAAIVDAIKGGKAVDIYVVDANGEMPEVADGTAAYVYKHEKDKAEDSKLVIAYEPELYAKMSEQYVRFAFDVELYGVKSTVIADCAKVSKWTYKGYEAKLSAGRLSPIFKGDQTFKLTPVTVPVEKTVDGKQVVDYTYTYYNPTSAAYKYQQDKNGKTIFNFNDYVNVVAENGSYMIRWSVVSTAGIQYTTETTGTGAAAVTTYTQHVGNLPKFVAKDHASWDAESFVLNPDYGTVKDAPINIAGSATSGYFVCGIDEFKEQWGLDWNGSNVNEYTIFFELVDLAKNPTPKVPVKNDAVATLPVKFQTPATISAVNTSDVVVKWSEHAGDMKANVATGISVVDMFNNTISNLAANRRIDTFWYSYKPNTAYITNTAINPNHNVAYVTDAAFSTLAYNQTIALVEFDEDPTAATKMVYITNDAEMVEGTHYTFDETTGAFEFIGKTAPAQDVTFTVMVEVGHMNNNGTPIKKAVNIVVKK